MLLKKNEKLYKLKECLDGSYDVREMMCGEKSTGILEIRSKPTDDSSTIKNTDLVAYVDQSLYGYLQVFGPGSTLKNTIERIVAKNENYDII